MENDYQMDTVMGDSFMQSFTSHYGPGSEMKIVLSAKYPWLTLKNSVVEGFTLQFTLGLGVFV